MRRWLVVWMAVGCGSSSAPSGPIARFALPDTGMPAPLAVPFPTDVYRDADGTIVDTLTDWTLINVEEPEPSALLGQYGAYDGFGLQAGVLFGVDGIPMGDTVDPATLTPDRAVFVDTDAGTTVPCVLGWDAFAHTITVVPEDVLVPGHRYAVGLLAGPAFATGPEIGASAQFRALRDNKSATGIYADAIATLVSAGADRTKLIAATLYTTTTEHRHALDTGARLFAGAYGAPPALNTTSVAAPFRYTRFGRTTHAGWTATLDEWLGVARKATDGSDLPGYPGGGEPASTGMAHDAIAAIVNATIVSPWFPRTFAKTAAYDDGTTAYDASDHAIPADATAQIPVMIVVPAGTPPAAGFPVVIFQHGLGGQRMDALAIANTFARAGIATVAVDGPLHGMRDPSAVDAKSNGTGTYTGPDGLADSSNPLILVDVIGNLRSSLRARDVLWQFAFDLTSLRRMIDTVDLSPIAAEFGGTAPALDHAHVALVGWSLGGLTSIIFSAMATDIDPVVFVSPASNLASAFAMAPVYAAQSTLIAAVADVHAAALDAGRFAAVVQLIEGLDGPGDTGAFAPLVAQQHSLWHITALEDESVPQSSTDQLARAFGATQLTPNVRPAARVPQAPSPLVPGASGRVAGFLEVSPGNHSHTFYRFSDLTYQPPYPPFVTLAKPVTIRQTVVREQAAITAFIQSTWSGAPKIAVTDPNLVPVADFDDDGYCDDTERAAGTDPFDPASVPPGTPDCARDLGFTKGP